MLLSTGDLSVSIALRCCPAALKYHQGLESTESQRIWSYGCLEKGKRSVIILAALTILFFVLQLFYISNTLSVLLFTLCHCVSHWIFIQKQFFALKSGFRNEKRDLKSENYYLPQTGFKKLQRKRELNLHKRQAGSQQS